MKNYYNLAVDCNLSKLKLQSIMSGSFYLILRHRVRIQVGEKNCTQTKTVISQKRFNILSHFFHEILHDYSQDFSALSVEIL